jgi:hypothetical protein
MDIEMEAEALLRESETRAEAEAMAAAASQLTKTQKKNRAAREQRRRLLQAVRAAREGLPATRPMPVESTFSAPNAPDSQPAPQHLSATRPVQLSRPTGLRQGRVQGPNEARPMRRGLFGIAWMSLIEACRQSNQAITTLEMYCYDC